MTNSDIVGLPKPLGIEEVVGRAVMQEVVRYGPDAVKRYGRAAIEAYEQAALSGSPEG